MRVPHAYCLAALAPLTCLFLGCSSEQPAEPPAVQPISFALLTCSSPEKLVASDAQQLYQFGSSVAIEGDTALVGSEGPSDVGWVYVFERQNGTWVEVQKLSASDPGGGDLFGYSVALHGDLALIGAFGADLPSASDAGAAYVFERTATGWEERQILTASDAASSDDFGFSVALA